MFQTLDRYRFSSQRCLQSLGREGEYYPRQTYEQEASKKCSKQINGDNLKPSSIARRVVLSMYEVARLGTKDLRVR